MHTKGPWTAEYPDKHDGWGIISARGKDGTGWKMYFVGATHDEMHANARLIAAAPELLEALEALLDGRPTEEPPNEMSYAHRNWVLFEKGREAIRKARTA